MRSGSGVLFSPAAIALQHLGALFHGQAWHSLCQQHQANQFSGHVGTVFSCLPVVSRAGAMRCPCCAPCTTSASEAAVSARGAALPQGHSSTTSSGGSIFASCHANCILLDTPDSFPLPPGVNSLQLECQEVGMPRNENTKPSEPTAAAAGQEGQASHRHCTPFLFAHTGKAWRGL